MTQDTSNKRKHVRVFFSPAEEVRATLDQPAGPLTVPVLNISEGGLCFTLPRDQELVPGQGLHLTMLEDRFGVLLQGKIPLEIRWTLRHEKLATQSFGCAFISLPETQRHCLVSLITEKIASGQNA